VKHYDNDVKRNRVNEETEKILTLSSARFSWSNLVLVDCHLGIIDIKPFCYCCISIALSIRSYFCWSLFQLCALQRTYCTSCNILNDSSMCTKCARPLQSATLNSDSSGKPVIVLSARPASSSPATSVSHAVIKGTAEFVVDY